MTKNRERHSSNKIKPKETAPQHYAGVFSACKKNGDIYYRASLTHRRKHISLGSYSSAREAHEAYLEGSRLLADSHITLMDFTEDSPLPFEKWVCLINFRDNGLYLGNPIYIGQRLFYYYITPSHVLKFDMDDLFYYSSHKIMRRGNHYFVADYGMQVNLASRYGIKNYAVCGVDFRFRNGDNTDFRRENLEILNSYHGVRLKQQKNGQYCYTVRIHVRGNLLVGHYATELEAAIAYNKAIDILLQRGVCKNYTPNYIDGISPAEYAEIYTSLEVSQNILNFRPNPSET
ncbi:MAG: hypothetical protein NC251_12090 [Lachnoclostridium sp.]|nr:hypothetical protein [Lachnospira sp.]MCM1249154.1 hypothetical protein [Lachnoclostridium sp.]MCM1536650.1 hypothetical protein [Clostridium sp.]